MCSRVLLILGVLWHGLAGAATDTSLSEVLRQLEGRDYGISHYLGPVTQRAFTIAHVDQNGGHWWLFENDRLIRERAGSVLNAKAHAARIALDSARAQGRLSLFEYESAALVAYRKIMGDQAHQAIIAHRIWRMELAKQVDNGQLGAAEFQRRASQAAREIRAHLADEADGALPTTHPAERFYVRDHAVRPMASADAEQDDLQQLFHLAPLIGF